nr:hypothetical protein [Rhodococcus sp. WS7]
MLACDCTVTRILLDENGVPLDCGKEARTATVPQRRALAVRDGGVRSRDAGLRRGGAMPIISFTGTMVAQQISTI